MTPSDRSSLRGRALLAHVLLVLLLLLAVRLYVAAVRRLGRLLVHAAVGCWIWQHGQARSHTLFLWSDSEPWIAHSWLSELVLYGLLAAGGESPQFYLLHAFTCTLVVLPVFLLCCGGDGPVA